jgi:hypothetical protein
MTPEQIKNLFNKPYSRLLILGIIGVLIVIGTLIGHRFQEDQQNVNKIKHWKTTYSFLITNLTNDFKKAQLDIQNGSTKDLGTVCDQIRKDSLNAESKPAIPDNSIEANWKVGLKDDAAGGAECSEAVKTGSQSTFTKASNDFTKGSTALAAANKSLQALTK